MTLEEAIIHAEEVAELHENRCKFYTEHDMPECEPPSRKCADEHRQLAEWLKELKNYRKENDWISCSERLPDPIGHTRFLVTTAHFDNRFKGRFVAVSEYEARDEEIAPYWDIEVPRDGVRVVAWKPLPEPYRGEQDEYQ